MAFSLIPDRVYHSVLEIDINELKNKGITLLLADLDNTLISYGDVEVSPEILAWRRTLEAHGVALFLLSNSRKPERPRHYASVLDIPYIGHAGKPKPKNFRRALEETGRKPHEAAMVGDQIFTDILGAKGMGIYAILVEPIQMAGNPGRYVRYGIETPFRRMGLNKTQHHERKR